MIRLFNVERDAYNVSTTASTQEHHQNILPCKNVIGDLDIGLKVE
jgi:hypothetical protein